MQGIFVGEKSQLTSKGMHMSKVQVIGILFFSLAVLIVIYFVKNNYHSNLSEQIQSGTFFDTGDNKPSTNKQTDDEFFDVQDTKVANND